MQGLEDKLAVSPRVFSGKLCCTLATVLLILQVPPLAASASEVALPIVPLVLQVPSASEVALPTVPLILQVLQLAASEVTLPTVPLILQVLQLAASEVALPTSQEAEAHLQNQKPRPHCPSCCAR